MASRYLKVFISYSTNDKILAGELKSTLEYFGFDVFLAHHDLHPTVEWQKKILEELSKCKLFLPLLTKNYHGSDWADQEAGYALALEKSISSVRVGVEPYGFLSTRQAFDLKRKEVKSSCREFVLKIMQQGNPLRNLVIDSVISEFAQRGGGYNKAIDLSLLLYDCDYLSKRELKKIFQVSLENDQVYESTGATKHLRWLVHKYEPQIDDRIWKFAKRFAE